MKSFVQFEKETSSRIQGQVNKNRDYHWS